MAAPSEILREALEFNRAVGSFALRGMFMTPAEVVGAALNSQVPIWLRVPDAARISQLSTDEISDLIGEGKLRACRVAGKVRVSTASLFDLFDMSNPPIEMARATRAGNDR